MASGAVRAAEAQLEAAEAAMEAGEEGAAGRVADAERALDDAMDAAADGGGAGGDGDGFDGDGDDFDGDAFFGGHDDFDDVVDSDLEDDDDDDDDDDEPRREITPEADDADPPSFSRVDRDRLHEFPRFARAHATVRVETEVHAGEVLYLPAGWFHEVTSVGEGEMRCHLALNYWFHPPVSRRGGRVHVRVRDPVRHQSPAGDVGERLGDVGKTPRVERSKVGGVERSVAKVGKKL